MPGIVLQKEGTYKKKYDRGKGFKYFLLNYRWFPVFLVFFFLKLIKKLENSLHCIGMQVLKWPCGEILTNSNCRYHQK